jgi:hypothetical protein
MDADMEQSWTESASITTGWCIHLCTGDRSIRQTVAKAHFFVITGAVLFTIALWQFWPAYNN